MNKLKKTTCFLSALILCLGLCGCNSDDKSSSKVESVVETTEQETTEAVTEEITTENITQPETTETESTLYEENNTIISLLKAGFSFDGMDTPTINFSPNTNTYVVIAPTSTDKIGNEFDKAAENGEWDAYVKKFIELTNTITDSIQKINNESINIRVIHTLKTPAPLIVMENGELIFNLYDSESSEKAVYILKTQCDLQLESLGDVDIKYDTDSNNCTATFYFDSDQVKNFENEEYTTAFLKLNTAFKEMVEPYGNPKLTFQACLINDTTPFYTIENGIITLNTINNNQ